MKTLISPESLPGASTCVQLRSAYDLFVQSFDSYGFQREMILRKDADGYELHVYQHPGRRVRKHLSKREGVNLLTLFLDRCERNPDLLFNAAGARPMNRGFVRFQETAFLDCDGAALLAIL